MAGDSQSGKVIVLAIPKRRPADAPSAIDIGGQLKALRKRFRVPMRDLAVSIGLTGPSSWQHYEDKFKREFLPVDVARNIAPVFERHGADPALILAMTGTSPAPNSSPLLEHQRPLAGELEQLRRQLDDIEARAKALRRIIG